MALFNLPTRDSKSTLLNKAKQTTANKPKTNFANPMDVVRQKIGEKLGKYSNSYKTITNELELAQYVSKCIEDGVVAIDTETTGLDPISDTIVGVSLKSKSQYGVYIPINHISVFSKLRLDNQLTEKQVAKHLQTLVDNTATVWHNGIFDIRVLYWQLGVNVNSYNIYWDTLSGSHLLNENEQHGLKYLYNKYCTPEDQEDEIFKFSTLFENGKFNEVPIDIATIYAGHDADMTYDIYEFQHEFLSIDNYEQNTIYAGLAYVFNYIEMPIIKVVVDMENRGICIDTKLAKELSTKYNNLLVQAQQDFYKALEPYMDAIYEYNKSHNNVLSVPLNYGSPKQLSILLYDILKVNVVDKRNPRGTDANILEKLNLPICNAVLRCREYEKLINTYIDKIPASINQKTGRLHCRFKPTGTVTGRFSSSDPNLQNIPKFTKDVRKMFVASPGHVLIGCDYSQQEPRILAHLSGDEHLQQAYRDGKDIYAWVASVVYKVPYEECKEFRPDGTKNPDGEKRRSTLKAIVLGIMYSKEPKSIAEDLGISEKEAQNVFDTFFKTFPKIKNFIDNSQREARENGYVTTLWGRKRRLPNMQLPLYEFSINQNYIDNTFNPLEFNNKQQTVISEKVKQYYIKKLNSCKYTSQKYTIVEEASKKGIVIKQNDLLISDASRQCVNSKIQGSASEMTKLAMIGVSENQQLKDLGFSILLTIHDEIIGECPIENAKQASQLLRSCMVKVAEDALCVPMKCDVEITERWTGDVIEL